MKAIWNDQVLAESDRTVIVESNHYFPPDALNLEFFRTSPTRTSCPWKGEAHYYSVVVGDQTNEDAAWYYPDPKEGAGEIRGMVAFWRGVEITE